MTDDRWPDASPGNDGRDDESVREFADAIRAYREASGRPFPAWSEILEILHNLGYRKVSEGEDGPNEPPGPGSDRPDPLPKSGLGPSSEDP
ncbi:hypothetical protein ACYOEI_23010 [Singulisphaera rosea]